MIDLINQEIQKIIVEISYIETDIDSAKYNISAFARSKFALEEEVSQSKLLLKLLFQEDAISIERYKELKKVLTSRKDSIILYKNLIVAKEDLIDKLNNRITNLKLLLKQKEQELKQYGNLHTIYHAKNQ